MTNYQESLQEERAYLAKTLTVINQELAKDGELLTQRKQQLISSRREMWEDTAHYTYDFARVTEISQHLAALNRETASYAKAKERLQRYSRIVDSPYFGRFDFCEEGSALVEPIYLGLHTLTNSQNHEILVYDWRAPISSIFYRYEIGRAEYTSPSGPIGGDVSLKRQLKITNSELQYFFDCSLVINDEVLQEVLSCNASPKMKTIVETIQKEQDLIIRDTTSELLLVQGVAGSGKTSIALHRIAYLLYNGLTANLSSDNILIISPNEIFSNYISSVLPDLGEENVAQLTFDELSQQQLGDTLQIEPRHNLQEYLTTAENTADVELRRQSIAFKGSRTFARIIDRLIQHYERKLIPIEDVYFHGQTIAAKHLLKNQLLNNKIEMPLAKRLSRIEQRLFEKIHPLQKQRLEKIIPIVLKSEGRELEVKSFSRLLAIKESQALVKRLKKFTEVNYLALYKLLFNHPELFAKLGTDMELPLSLAQIITLTRDSIEKGEAKYEDCAPLLYLKLKLEGNNMFTNIKQVFIDEAQDYAPLHYEVFKLLFPQARYTVLGDINQALELNRNFTYYDGLAEILHKNNVIRLNLKKSYRSSYEINTFAQKLLPQHQEIIPFDRHEAVPVIVQQDSAELLDQALLNDLTAYLDQGYDSIAVICKTEKAALQLATRLNKKSSLNLVTSKAKGPGKGALVISAYMAKGLEFDVVLVYDVSTETYSSAIDQRLLYIACTRALHRLALYHSGEKSPLL